MWFLKLKKKSFVGEWILRISKCTVQQWKEDMYHTVLQKCVYESHNVAALVVWIHF